VRDANDPVPLGLQRRVTRTVALEGSSVPVEGKSIELDDEALGGPVGVDLVPQDLDIDEGGETVLTAEPRETIL
jgi:hypothetical protein